MIDIEFNGTHPLDNGGFTNTYGIEHHIITEEGSLCMAKVLYKTGGLLPASQDEYHMVHLIFFAGWLSVGRKERKIVLTHSKSLAEEYRMSLQSKIGVENSKVFNIRRLLPHEYLKSIWSVFPRGLSFKGNGKKHIRKVFECLSLAEVSEV